MERVQLPRTSASATRLKLHGAVLAFAAAALGSGAFYGFNYLKGVGDIELSFKLANDVEVDRIRREQAMLNLFKHCEDRKRVRELFLRLSTEDPNAGIRTYASVYLKLMGEGR